MIPPPPKAPRPSQCVAGPGKIPPPPTLSNRGGGGLPSPPTDFEHPNTRMKRLRRQYGAKRHKSGWWIWPSYPQELEGNTQRLLDACEEEHKAFFERIGL